LNALAIVVKQARVTSLESFVPAMTWGIVSWTSFSNDLKSDPRKPFAGIKLSKHESDQMSAKLFVGNLSFDLTENDLQDAFAAHGTVLAANLMMYSATVTPRVALSV